MRLWFCCAHLAHIVVVRVEVHTQLRQQSRPPLETPLQGDRRDEYADSGSDQRRRIADAVQAFRLDELGDVRRELLEVGTNVVLEDETAERTRRLICGNVDKIRDIKPWQTCSNRVVYIKAV